MWKVAVGFVIFAALAMYILTKSGGDIDLGGEKHGVDVPHGTAASTPQAGQPAASAGSGPRN